MASPSLAERIKEARLAASLRLRRQLSQAEMAELVGKGAGQSLWQAQWSSYERGESEPSLVVIRAAAALSGLEPGYLAFGDSDAEPTVTEPVGDPVARPGPDPDRQRRGAAPPTKRRRGNG
jgi:transcriptional regulator with XRE-family HTH domain